ncbi:MAG: hypothetical protein UW73_C0012G0006 [Microgenomates group bacterium GW2011_GWB1_44_8]|nr:MAG: hypothetical protein UW73_C0012G0006 [Microgenomates group bacterium GW2011_GWB1_44_8]
MGITNQICFFAFKLQSLNKISIYQYCSKLGICSIIRLRVLEVESDGESHNGNCPNWQRAQIEGFEHYRSAILVQIERSFSAAEALPEVGGESLVRKVIGYFINYLAYFVDRSDHFYADLERVFLLDALDRLNNAIRVLKSLPPEVALIFCLPTEELVYPSSADQVALLDKLYWGYLQLTEEDGFYFLSCGPSRNLLGRYEPLPCLIRDQAQRLGLHIERLVARDAFLSEITGDDEMIDGECFWKMVIPKCSRAPVLS